MRAGREPPSVRENRRWSSRLGGGVDDTVPDGTNVAAVVPIARADGRERNLRSVLAEVQRLAGAGLAGGFTLDEAVHGANRALQSAVRLTLRGPA